MNKMVNKLDNFMHAIGYIFHDPKLLMQALTHPSLNLHNCAESNNNQRLEFLGDRVLGLVIADALFERDPHAKEGLLAPRFNALVRRETCADVARSVSLGEVLKIGRSETLSGGHTKDALLADGIEAVIAAIYLDGGFANAQRVILNLWQYYIEETVQGDLRDAKTRLQEWAQARKLALPCYTEVRREGPDHAPLFTIRAEIQSLTATEASARSKRTAEQAAAHALLEQVQKNP